MQHLATALLITSATGYLTAAVPLRWTVETSRVQPAVFEAYQGETLELEATLQSYGKPIAIDPQADWNIYWQTNGMGSAYWSAPATIKASEPPSSTSTSTSTSSLHLLSATFTPSMDVGARAYNCFIGSPSNNYRAAFQLRLRPSPGALPNALPLPTPVIDFARVQVLNPPWSTGGGGCDTNAVDALANSAVVTNALTVATTNRVTLLESSKADKSALDAHVNNKSNPHAVTATQIGAVPLVEDMNGNKTAVTIGSRTSDVPVGEGSLANGSGVIAYGLGSHAEGMNTVASGNYSHTDGVNTSAKADYSYAGGVHAETEGNDDYAFAWNGDGRITVYISHGPGTFNINPKDGLNGFYIGEQTLERIIFESIIDNISAESYIFSDAVNSVVKTDLDGKADKADISATNPTFSNAVMEVGLNIDTNSVAILNEIANTFGGFPIEGTATTVGGLLAALAASVAWLKKNKVQTLKLNDNSVKTSADGGVAKLDDFFTESNSLLVSTIAAKLPYPINTDGTIIDRNVNVVTSGAFVIPEGFKDLLIRYTGVPASLTFSGADESIADWGDNLPTELGDYLITVTRIAASECYIRIIELKERA